MKSKQGFGSRYRRGRVFYSYLLSYLLILLIPIVMSIALFNRARSILQLETSRAAELLLGQMKSYLDTVMKDAQHLGFQVSYNQRLETLMYSRGDPTSTDYFRAYQIVNDFFTYKFAASGVVEFYVYLPNIDMILSPRGYFTSRNYYLVQMSQMNIGYQEWLSGFSSKKITSYASGAAVTDDDTVKDTIVITTPLPTTLSSGMPTGWVVVHLESDFVRDIFSHTNWTNGTIVLIYHEASGVITASHNLYDFPSGNSFDQAVFDDAKRRVLIADHEYHVQSLDSATAAWKYISLVPVDAYADRFRTLTRFTVMAFTICGAVGIAVIMWVTLARYRPIRHLLDLLEPETDGSVSLQSDEFAIISRAFESTLAEEQVLRREITEAKPLLAQRALRRLLKGNAILDAAYADELRELEISFPHQYIALVLIDSDETRSADSELAFQINEDSSNVVHVIRDIEGLTGILVNQSTSFASDLYRSLVTEKERLENEQDILLSIGLSDVHEIGGGFSVVYHEAKAALTYRLVKGRRKPIRYAEVIASGNTYYYPMDEETKLINSIKTGYVDEALETFEGIFRINFEKTLLSAEMARCLMFDLTSTMIKAMNSLAMGNEDAEFWSDIKPIARLIACRSLEQLKTEMTEILTRVCAHIHEATSSQAEQHRREIVDYIHENYRDINLGPERIAAHLNKNPDYLSRLFRSQMSVGISEYTKRYRVAEAKRFLETTGQTIREVAESVGFIDSNSFIRAFKKIEGITPGEYRHSPPAYKESEQSRISELK